MKPKREKESEIDRDWGSGAITTVISTEKRKFFTGSGLQNINQTFWKTEQALNHKPLYII